MRDEDVDQLLERKLRRDGFCRDNISGHVFHKAKHVGTFDDLIECFRNPGFEIRWNMR